MKNLLRIFASTSSWVEASRGGELGRKKCWKKSVLKCRQSKGGPAWWVGKSKDRGKMPKVWWITANRGEEKQTKECQIRFPHFSLSRCGIYWHWNDYGTSVFCKVCKLYSLNRGHRNWGYIEFLKSYCTYSDSCQYLQQRFIEFQVRHTKEILVSLPVEGFGGTEKQRKG